MCISIVSLSFVVYRYYCRSNGFQTLSFFFFATNGFLIYRPFGQMVYSSPSWMDIKGMQAQVNLTSSHLGVPTRLLATKRAQALLNFSLRHPEMPVRSKKLLLG